MDHPILITDLPLEVRRMIAGLCPMLDLYALSRTCRILRDICDDVHVLQDSFLNNARDPVANAVPDKQALFELVAADLNSRGPLMEKSVWSLLGLATSEMPALTKELRELLEHSHSFSWNLQSQAPGLLENGRVRRRLTNIVAAMATMTVFGYPDILGFSTTTALTLLATIMFQLRVDGYLPMEYRQGPPDGDSASMPTAVSFCLAVGLLENRIVGNMFSLSTRLTYHFAGIFSRWDREEYDFDGQQSRALLTVACVTWMIRSDPAVVRASNLPDPASLPLLNVVQRHGHIPLPYGGAPLQKALLSWERGGPSVSDALDNFALHWSWSLWLRNNVDDLVDELAGGEWVGYSTPHQLGKSPLTNVFFSLKESPPGKDVLALEADHGVDDVSSFTLRGTFNRSTGKAHLMKQYGGGHGFHMWHQVLILTPLGLVGYWGTGRESNAGYVWMYKRDWARPGAFKHVRNIHGPPQSPALW